MSILFSKLMKQNFVVFLALLFMVLFMVSFMYCLGNNERNNDWKLRCLFLASEIDFSKF